jgi:broad specificity phosphatase PhoE
MPTVLLIRHGQASFGTAEYDRLSALGIQQAEETGYSLRRRGVRPDRAVTGSLLRQRDTATACLPTAGFGAAPTVDARWNEYDHVSLVRDLPAVAGPDGPGGPVDPAPLEDVSARAFQELLDIALLRWIGREGDEVAPESSWAAFANGANAALDELFTALGSGGTAVVFTSAGPIAAVGARLLGLPPAGIVALNRVAVNGAITKVVRGRSGTSLVTFNDHAHFDGERSKLLTYR